MSVMHNEQRDESEFGYNCTHLRSIVHETCIDWVVKLAQLCMRISIVNYHTTVSINLKGERIWV